MTKFNPGDFRINVRKSSRGHKWVVTLTHVETGIKTQWTHKVQVYALRKALADLEVAVENHNGTKPTE